MAYALPETDFAFHKFIVKYISDYFENQMTSEQLEINKRQKKKKNEIEDEIEKIYQLRATFSKEQYYQILIDFRKMYNMNNYLRINMPFTTTNFHNKLYFGEQVHVLSTQVFEYFNPIQITTLMKDMINDNPCNIKYHLFKYFTKDMNILPYILIMIMIDYI